MNSLSVSSARAAVIIIAFMLIFPVVVTGQVAGLKKVEYNKEYLVQNVVVGTIAPARLGSTPYRLGADGTVSILPATGSVTFNYRTGDTAVKLAGDHVEPAVTLYYSDDRGGSESRAFNILSCVGNEVKVLTGEAKGATGVVIGKHGGSEHVMVDFKNPEVLKTMLPGDKMAVYAYGVGMELTNVKDVKTMNMSPQLIEAFTRAGMGITPAGKLRVPVALTVPAKIMGSGLGSDHVYSGDYDIQLFDEKVNREYGLDKLRFGDIVAIIDADNSYGRIYKTGAITIGVITHSGSVIAGHGPGVTTLFTSSNGNIEFHTDSKANLLYLLLQ